MDLVERGNAGKYRHPWETARFEFVSQLVKEYCQSDNPIVLDIGSGDGFFLESLSTRMGRGQFLGLDIALNDTEVAQLNGSSTNGVQFSNDPEYVQELVQRPADVVLLLDVIEHIADDRGFLRDLVKRPYLTPETIMIITVPAFWSLRTAHDDYLKHFRRYSLSEAENSVSSAGLRVIAGGYFFFSLLVPRIAAKVKESIRPPKQQFGIGRWRGGFVATKLIEAVLLTDAAIGRAFTRIGVRLPGLSVYLVCRRSS